MNSEPFAIYIAMQDICDDPWLNWVDVGRLIATSRGSAYIVFHSTAGHIMQMVIAELRRRDTMPLGLEVALQHICMEPLLDPFLDLADYAELVATQRFFAGS